MSLTYRHARVARTHARPWKKYLLLLGHADRGPIEGSLSLNIKEIQSTKTEQDSKNIEQRLFLPPHPYTTTQENNIEPYNYQCYPCVMKRTAGRPKQDVNREVNMTLRLTLEEKADLRDAAQRAGLSMASWLRERILWVLRQEQADPYPHGPAWPRPERPTKQPPGERLSHD